MKTILLYILLTTQVLSAFTYYVAKTGNDSENGSQGSPWLTMSHAHSMMVSGDSVIVLAGTYNERVRITKNNLTFIAQSSSTHSVGGFWLDADSIVIKGFEITNPVACDGYGTETRENGTGVYVEGDYCIVDGNTIHHTTANGIYTRSVSNNNQFLNNTISWCGLDGIEVNGKDHYIYNNDISHILRYTENWTNAGGDADGIRYFGSGHIFRSNYVHDIYHSDYVEGAEGTNVNCHIDMAQTWGPATDIIFDGNFLHNPNLSSEDAQVFMIEQINDPVSNITIVNNVLMNLYTIINVTNKSTQGDINGIKIYNNTFYGTVFYAVTLRGCPGSEVKNNNFYDCGENKKEYLRWYDDVGEPWHGNPDMAYKPDYDYNAHYMTSGSPYGDPQPHDIWDKNPYCVDIGAFNFRLKSASPLINKGTELENVISDYDGMGRPNGPSTDIGAFEFDPLTGIKDEPSIQENYVLKKNYPNPFNPSTTIGYQLSVAGTVQLTIFNMIGQQVWQEKIGNQASGAHEVNVNLVGHSSGIYFYRH